MNKLILSLIFIVYLIMTACSKNEELKFEIDDEPKLELTGEYLKGSDWSAKLISTNSSASTSHFVIYFLTNKSGQCKPYYGEIEHDGPFSYQISDEIITFNGSLEGEWTCIEFTKTKLILQSFKPNEYNLVLNKILRE